MTDNARSSLPSDRSGNNQDPQGTTDVAREQASDVKDHAVRAGGDLAGTIQERASDVVGEAKSQAADLAGRAREELRDQATAQQRRVADQLHQASNEFSSMVRDSDAQGLAADLVYGAAERTGRVAGWLDDHDPSAMVDEVRRFAARRPGTFIAMAAAVGVVAGRLTRSTAGQSASGRGAPSGTQDGSSVARGPVGGSRVPVSGVPVSGTTAPTTPVFEQVAEHDPIDWDTSGGPAPAQGAQTSRASNEATLPSPATGDSGEVER